MDPAFLSPLSLLLAFALISLASNSVGQFFSRWKLPLITGFLATGILAGPYVLDLITKDAVAELTFVDQISLAVIAFAAGNELYLKELRSRLKTIAWVAATQTLSVFSLVTATVFLLASFVPFLEDASPTVRLAAALLTGSIMVARSPSSAIAIVNELRAKGPFTQTVLGVTVVIDIVVIILFAIAFSVSDGLLSSGGLRASTLLSVVGELATALATGVLLALVVHAFLSRVHHHGLRRLVVLSLGYAVFLGSEQFAHVMHDAFAIDIHAEPLLSCVLASFFVTNYTTSRDGFARIVESVGPPVYIAFFTLTGASLELDVLAGTWTIAAALFAVRALGLAVGARWGGKLAGEPLEHRRISWLSYFTQAGVGLGLAKGVSVAFPEWGPALATTIIAVIVLNQLIGPPLMKWTIVKVGENRNRADTLPFDGTRDALIFGVEGQSLALARHLRKADWQVTMACNESETKQRVEDIGVDIIPIRTIDEAMMAELQAERVDAIIALLSDRENLHICELAYQIYGTRNLVVRIDDPSYIPRFRELGALVIDPRSAMINVLESGVRSPTATAVLLGMDLGQELVDVEVTDPDAAGIAIRDLRLPLNVAILYVHRDGLMVASKGTTVLRVGDRVTISGPKEGVEQVTRKFEAWTASQVLPVVSDA